MHQIAPFEKNFRGNMSPNPLELHANPLPLFEKYFEPPPPPENKILDTLLMSGMKIRIQ